MSLSPNIQTLRNRSDFLAIAATGKKWVAPAFILQIGPEHPPTGSIRFGLTASRKVGNAVARNRAKRRLRELAKELLPHALTSHDYVLIARDNTGAYNFGAMHQDMVKGLKRLGLWNT